MTDSEQMTTSRRTAPPVFQWARNWIRTGTIDALIWIVATPLAFALVAGVSAMTVPVVLTVLFASLAAKVVAGTVLGLHLHSWRKVGFHDAVTVATAMAAVAAFGTILALVFGPERVPFGVPIVDALASTVGMLAARGSVRLADERNERAPTDQAAKRVVLIGAGEAGVMLARELARNPEAGRRVIGFLDDDPAKQGRTIAGVPVLGTTRGLADVVATQPLDEVVICIPSASGRDVREIVNHVRATAPLAVCTIMPALHDLVSGKVKIDRIRNVTIDDLLRRPTVEMDTGSVNEYLRGRRVLVTGAGGSIGSELIRQICPFEPAELILLGHGENSIFQLERELDAEWPGIRYTSVIGQVQNIVRLRSVFARHQPEVVFHAAAHKHVPLMEQNVEEAVFNNIVGSRNLVEVALDAGVTHFVNISTDKAVNPTSVMGASKRVVEMLIESASRRAGPDQTFVSVRFGNVLGSRGSAVPTFKKQIAEGGPVTITHPNMVRYFMTIPEATRLVLQASAQGKNGEIYILDMGEPVKILDLVTDLIRLSGLEPDVDIPIVFTGTRPGEKLYEELMTDTESTSSTEHEKIFVARPAPIDSLRLDELVENLTEAAIGSDGDEIRTLLFGAMEGARIQLPLEKTTDDPDAAPKIMA